MNLEDIAALRDEIEGLTIREAKARGEVATETLNILRALGLAPRVDPTQTTVRHPAAAPASMPTTAAIRCPVCARAPGDEGECALGVECPAVARPSNGRMTNKGAIEALRNAGPVQGPIGSSPPMTLEQRAAALAAPAFDANGEPIG